MKKRYLSLTFAFALSLTTHAALCMDTEAGNEENKDTISTTTIKRYHTFTQPPSGAFGDWTFKLLPGTIGYGATWKKPSSDLNQTFKKPDMQENL